MPRLAFTLLKPCLKNVPATRQKNNPKNYFYPVQKISPMDTDYYSESNQRYLKDSNLLGI
jgi:hypothetical protein